MSETCSRYLWYGDARNLYFHRYLLYLWFSGVHAPSGGPAYGHTYSPARARGRLAEVETEQECTRQALAARAGFEQKVVELQQEARRAPPCRRR